MHVACVHSNMHITHHITCDDANRDSPLVPRLLTGRENSDLGRRQGSVECLQIFHVTSELVLVPQVSPSCANRHHPRVAERTRRLTRPDTATCRVVTW
jgi:hypothetical protein